MNDLPLVSSWAEVLQIALLFCEIIIVGIIIWAIRYIYIIMQKPAVKKFLKSLDDNDEKKKEPEKINLD